MAIANSIEEQSCTSFAAFHVEQLLVASGTLQKALPLGAFACSCYLSGCKGLQSAGIARTAEALLLSHLFQHTKACLAGPVLVLCTF